MDTKSGKFVKSIKFDYQNAYSLSNGRVLIHNSKKNLIIDLNTFEQKEHKCDQWWDCISVDNDHIISYKYKTKYENENDYVFSVWHVDGLDMKLIRQFELNLKIRQGFWLKTLKNNKFIGYSIFFNVICFLDTDGNNFKTLKLENLIDELEVVDDLLIIETSESCVEIYSSGTYQLLRRISRSDCELKLVGCTPFEIFVKDKTNNFIDVYALDDDFTYLGALDTRNITKYPIESLKYIDGLSAFIFGVSKFYLDSFVKISTIKCE